MSMLDDCPACGRHITDYDDDGMEAEDGQRWCLMHSPQSDRSAGGDDFTEYDEAMLSVMADLERLRSRLLDHAYWFADQWVQVSDDDVPFFDLIEEVDDTKDDGMSSCKVVFVLDEIELPTALLEQFRQ